MPIVALGDYMLQIDAADLPVIDQYGWHVDKHEANIYAVRRETCPETGVKKKIYLHRQLMGVTDPVVFIDHRDGNGLNNRRKNLRPFTIGQNNGNRTHGMAAHFKRANGGVRGV